MDKTEIWPTIHLQRLALADDLASLTEDQWESTTLCEDWTVRDTLAHMTASAKMTPPAFFAKMIGSGFSLKKIQAKDIAVERGDSSADALARFNSVVKSSKHPPGPTDTWLGEAIIHAEDIRRPLGIAHETPTEASVRVADFYKGSNLIIGAKNRISGLKLEATDAQWSHGDGPTVSGPILSLVMAMTGRKAAHADLTGEGIAILAARP